MIGKLVVASVVVVGLVHSMASAAPTIVAGHHPLLPNTPGQQILITTTGNSGDGFQGANLYLRIGDGTSGPIITAIDMIGPGTLFFGNNNGQFSFGSEFEAPGRDIVGLVSTQSGFVGPNGVLAIVTIDTTGYFGESWKLIIDHPLFGPSDLPPWEPGQVPLENGYVGGFDYSDKCVPEPSSVVLGLFGMATLALVPVRRRRVKR